MPTRRPSRQRARARLDARLVTEWLATAERGDLRAMERMAAAEPRLIDAAGRGPYWTGHARALHYVAHRNHLRVARWLLAHGASAAPLAKKDIDWLPLHFAAGGGHRDLVRLLLRHGAQMDIFAAAALGDASAVRRMLREDRSLASRRGPDGAMPLHFAKTPAVAKALLAAGANPNARDTYHHGTVLQWTIDRPAVAALVAAARGSVDIYTASALGDLGRVRTLVARDPRLVNRRVPKNVDGAGVEGETPLAIAARYGRRPVVSFLIAHGADADTPSSPLPDAVAHGDLTIVK